VSDRTRVALVTGGGSGVGAVSAKALAAAGFAVVVCGRRKEPLQEVVGDIERSGGRAASFVTDVSDAAQVDSLFSAVRTEFGRLDVLFNNAGGRIPNAPIDEIDTDDWEKILAVNLTGPFLCTRAAVGLMRSQEPGGGRIISNGSVSAQVPRPHTAAYASSKSGLTGLMRATTLDTRGSGVCCTQIDIGNAATDMSARMDVGVLQADGSVRSEPRFDPQHVADLVVHIARLPLEVNIPSVTIMATDMPFAGRG